jgi:N-acetylglucosaminylphosphatidylinositol deacetylase
MSISLFLLLPILFYAAWLTLSQIVYAYFPLLRNTRVGIVIAHPDDEAMFFSPTVIALTEPRLKNHVRILCLCSGRLRSRILIRTFGWDAAACAYWF